MSKAAEKITDLEYNEFVTLSVIETDVDLSNIVKDDIKLPINVLRKMAVDGQLKSETKELLRDIFDKIILTKSDLIEKYSNISETIKSPENNKSIKPEKVKLLPRRYGKEKILTDIQKQDGKMTPLQKAMLELNDLKNLTVNLNNRCIKTYFNEDKVLTNEDCMDIISVVKIAKQKLKTTLSKK